MSLPDNYIGLSPLYCGRDAPPSGDPAWMATAGVALNKVVAMPNSAGAGGAGIGAWGCFAVHTGTSEIFSPANQGHTDGADNRVTKYNPAADSPSWTLCSATTPTGQVVANAAHNADGKPQSRHGYNHAFWVPQVNRIILMGCRGFYSSGGDLASVDGFNPDNNTWDVADTRTMSFSGNGYGVCVDPSTGYIWSEAMTRYNPATNAYLSPNITGVVQSRFPVAFDSLRNRVFTLQWGDGQNFNVGSAPLATVAPAAGGAHSAVTFNASADYTQFLAEKMVTMIDATSQASPYAGMCYDAGADCFWWYSGHGTQAGHLWKIIPNNGTAWDMVLFQPASGSVTMAPTADSGVNGRVNYIPNLKGISVCPSATSPIYFIKTSN